VVDRLADHLAARGGGLVQDPLLVETTRSAVKAYAVDRIRTKRCGAYPTLAGDRVFKDYFTPINTDDLPAVMVYATSETSRKFDNSQDEIQLKITFEIQAKEDDADNQLDVISDQIKRLFRNDPYLGGYENGLVEEFRYTGGQLTYDDKRHFNGLAWSMDFEATYKVSILMDASAGRVTDFNEVDANYLPSVPPQIEDTGSQIIIPQS